MQHAVSFLLSFVYAFIYFLFVYYCSPDSATLLVIASIFLFRCKLSKKQSHLDSTELEELESTLASVRSVHSDKGLSESKADPPHGAEPQAEEAMPDEQEEIFLFEAEEGELANSKGMMNDCWLKPLMPSCDVSSRLVSYRASL